MKQLVVIKRGLYLGQVGIHIEDLNDKAWVKFPSGALILIAKHNVKPLDSYCATDLWRKRFPEEARRLGV